MSEFNCAHCGALVMSGNIDSAFRSIARRLQMKNRFSYCQIGQQISHDQVLCDECFEELMRLHSEIDKAFLDDCDDKERMRRMGEYKCAHCGQDTSPANQLWMSECFYDDDTEQWIGHGAPLCDKCWDERMRLHAKLDKEFFGGGMMCIVKIDENAITFNNGDRIWFDHDQQCYEWNYADFLQIEDSAKTYVFAAPLRFETVEDAGFRFGDDRRMFFIPCYSEQNGWYTNEVDIYYSGYRFGKEPVLKLEARAEDNDE